MPSTTPAPPPAPTSSTPRALGRLRGCSGQASVELVALLPLIAVLAIACWQLVVAGHTAWMAATAAQVAARAAAVGEVPPDRAARAVLSSRLREGLRVRVGDDGEVRVRIRVPGVLPGVPALPAIGATARFADQ